MAKILLTGATGYIGKRLLLLLVANNHEVICLVRDPRRLDLEAYDGHQRARIKAVKADLLDEKSLTSIDKSIDAAFYLVHSMATTENGFNDLEFNSAKNFAGYLKTSSAKQVIYLSGIVNDKELSAHLSSRKNVEEVLASGGVSLTVLRAAIIVGSGSASFEIIRDLVEKLPLMIAPKWLNTLCQPISIRDVLQFLEKSLLNPETYNDTFDIGGPDILSYKEMLLGYAHNRNLKRLIITLPVLSPRLSSLWLYFVTSTSFTLARNLVDSMKNEVICKDTRLQDRLQIKPVSYSTALNLAFHRISQMYIVSSWKDAVYNQSLNEKLLNNIEVPTHGCFKDHRTKIISKDVDQIVDNIWKIGGDRGWYYANWLWGIRGFLDKLVGGVGLRRGRRSPKELKAGDALDFWRVLHADLSKKKLLLYAEMKLPGEAWLEFSIISKGKEHEFRQKATFRPRGLWGRLYWYAVLPFHGLIFSNMMRNIIHYR